MILKVWHRGYIDGMFKAIFCDKKNIFVKNKTLDVLTKIDGELVNIEVNSGYYSSLHIRNAAHIFSKYDEHSKIGDNYGDMPNFYQINFTKGLSKKYPLLGIYTVNDKDSKIDFIDNLTIYEYNMDKIHEACYNKDDMTYSYVAILDSSEEEL